MEWRTSELGRLVWIVSAATLCVACASSQDRFDQAQLYQSTGRYVEAASEYIDVLSREPQWTEARTALADVGPRAIDELVSRARAAGEAKAYRDGIEALDRALRLQTGARSVGFTLDLPTDVGSLRTRLVDGAIEAYRTEGEEAIADGSWAIAVRAYDAAIDLAGPSSRHSPDLTQRQGEIHLLWGEERLERGAARGGFDLAERAVSLVGPSAPLASRARAFQERALQVGSRRVAFLPFSRVKTVDLEAPKNFTDDFSAILELEKWPNPPIFIVSADPIRLLRELRRAGLEEAIVETRQAAELGRNVDADYVVVGEIVSFQVSERDTEEEVKRARVRADRAPARGPREVSYVERSRRVEYRVEVAYRIVDARSRRPLRDRTMSEDRSKRVRTARYAGDYDDLELSGSRLELFTGETERRGLEDLGHELADRLAARLAARVFEDLLNEIR